MLKIKKGKNNEQPEQPEQTGNTEGQEARAAAETPKTPKEPKRKKAPAEKKVPQKSADTDNLSNEEKEPVQQHRIINSLVGNLSHALEEDVNEIDELLEQQPQTKEYHNKDKKPGKYRFFLIFGLLVFWLAIVGTITTVRSLAEFIHDISNQTALKNEFEDFLLPVVIVDPPEFVSAENLQSSTIIASAIWQIILTGDTEAYPKVMGTMTVPEQDVEKAARSLFGHEFEINHRTIDYIVMTFEYASENKSYIIPENPPHLSYLPGVASISNSGDIYTLTVDYIAPTPHSIAGIERDAERVKTMIYTVKRTRGAKSIQSIKFDKAQEGSLY